MTKQELIEMTGSEEQAEYAMNILLKNCKESFVRMAINAELAEIGKQIEAFKEEGTIVSANGSDRVNWGAADAPFGNEPGAFWKATEEQQAQMQAQSEAIEERCREAECLIYRRNRTVSLIAVR